MTNEQCLARAKGIGGQIEVYADRVRIIRKGLIGTLRGMGDLEIPLATLSAVRFQPGGFFSGNGFIQLVTAGTKLEAGTFDPQADPSSLAFFSSEKKHFEHVKEVLERHIGAKPTPQQRNGTDLSELERLADLRDRGIITEEEFTAKKRQILRL